MMVERHSTHISGARVDHGDRRRAPRCPYCGRPYAPRGDKDGCRSCRRIGAEAGYMPSWDPGFVDRYAVMLMERFGLPEVDRQFLRPSEVPCTPEDAKWARRVLARWGFRFATDNHRGTRLTSWTRRREAEPVDETVGNGG